MSGSIPNPNCPREGAQGYSYSGMSRGRPFNRDDLCPGPLIRQPACVDVEVSFKPNQGRPFNVNADMAECGGRRAMSKPAPSVCGDPFNLEKHMIESRQKAWERLRLEEAQQQAIETQSDDVSAPCMSVGPPPRPRRQAIGGAGRAGGAGGGIVTGSRGRPLSRAGEADGRSKAGRPFDPDRGFEYTVRICKAPGAAGRQFDTDRDITFRRLNLPTSKQSRTTAPACAPCVPTIGVQPPSPPHSPVQRLPRICPRPVQNVCTDSSPRSSSPEPTSAPAPAPCRRPVCKMEPAPPRTKQATRYCTHGHTCPSCPPCPPCPTETTSPSAPCPPRTTEGTRSRPTGASREIRSSQQRSCRPKSSPQPTADQPPRRKREAPAQCLRSPSEPVCPVQPPQNRRGQTPPRPRSAPNYIDNQAGANCPSSSHEQSSIEQVRRQIQRSPNRTLSGSDYQYAPIIPDESPGQSPGQSPLQTPPQYIPMNQVQARGTRSIPLYSPGGAINETPDQLPICITPLQDSSPPVAGRPATPILSDTPLNHLQLSSPDIVDISDELNYELPNMERGPCPTPTRRLYDSSNSNLSPALSTPCSPEQFHSARSQDMQTPLWGHISSPHTPPEPTPQVSPDACTPARQVDLSRPCIFVNPNSPDRNGQDFMDDLYNRATLAGYVSLNSSSDYTPVSNQDNNSLSQSRYFPSPQNESTFYYNASMFDEPSDYNRTAPCPTPPYADANVTCVDLTDENEFGNLSVQEVPCDVQQPTCTPRPLQRTSVDELKAALVCPTPPAAPCLQTEAASGPGVCPSPQQRTQLQPPSPQQLSTSGTCEPCEQPRASLFRCLAKKLSTTYDFLSGLVAQPRSADVCPPPTNDEICNAGQQSFDINTLFASPAGRQQNRYYHFDQPSPGLRTMSSVSASQSPADRVCDMNRPDDSTAAGFSMRNLFAEPLNIPSSVKECANAKRCGKVKFDSSDKDEMQDVRHKQVRQAQLETLVNDTYCPGIIQETIDGRENFNRQSFGLSLNPDEQGALKADSPPKEDPMTLLEAFAIRIDRERTELRKDIPDGANQDKIAEVISNYFATHNPTDLNRSIKNHLLSESLQEQEEKDKAKGLSLDAEVQKLVTNFPSNDKVKLILYTGRTWPVETETT